MAILLRRRGGELFVLLVRRATRDGDRWSGHIALPGGVRQPEDASLLQTAVRETREEIGLDLSTDRLLGESDEERALVHGGRAPMRVATYVFAAEPEIDELTLSHEIDEAFWFPLDRAARGDFDALHWHRGLIPLPFRAWRYQGRTIWGITYGILRRLARHLG